MRIAQAAEERAIHQAKHRSGGADAQGQSKHRDQRELGLWRSCRRAKRAHLEASRSYSLYLQRHDWVDFAHGAPE